jgi:hypothetical protein
MYSLYVSPAAQSDVRAAFHWYESQRHGLGREFIENLDTLDSANQTFSGFTPRDRRKRETSLGQTFSLCGLLSF